MITFSKHNLLRFFDVRTALYYYSSNRQGMDMWLTTTPPLSQWMLRGTPLFGLDRPVCAADRVWFSGSRILNRVYNFTINLQLEQGVFLDQRPLKGCKGWRWDRLHVWYQQFYYYYYYYYYFFFNPYYSILFNGVCLKHCIKYLIPCAKH